MRKLLTYVNNSVIRKLIIGYVLVILIPMTIISVFLNEHGNKIVKNEFINRVENQLKQAKWSVDEIVISCMISTDSAKIDTSLLNVITPDWIDTELLNDMILYRLGPSIAALESHNSNIGSIRIYHGNADISDPNGLFIYDPGISSGEWPVAFSNLVETGFGNHGDMKMDISAIQGSNDAKSLVHFFRPIFSYNNSLHFVGVMEIGIYNDVLFLPLKNLADNGMDTVAMFDDDGNLIYVNNRDFVSPILQSKSRSGSMIVNGRSYTSVESYDESMKCMLVYYIPSDNINITGNAYGTYLLPIMLAGILTMLFLAFLITFYVLNDVRKLSRAMYKVESGELDTRIQIRRSDEFGHLAAAFNSMTEKIKGLMENLREVSKAEKEAIYKNMENQIKPHFLYNVLDAARMHAELEGNSKTSEALSRIMEYYIYNLSKSGSVVSVMEELKNLSTYIEIVNMLRHKPVKLSIHLDDKLECDLNGYLMLKFILQPIVENSIKYAFSDVKGDNFIFVYITIKDCKMILSVEDNGCGMPEARLTELQATINSCAPAGETNTGIGLVNIYQRIKLNYGADYGLTVESASGLGTCINLSLPVIRKEE